MLRNWFIGAGLWYTVAGGLPLDALIESTLLRDLQKSAEKFKEKKKKMKMTNSDEHLYNQRNRAVYTFQEFIGMFFQMIH